jgi:hypothetical protein
MAIRLRVVDGVLIAICAARSVEKPGDVYLDDGQHTALGDKFARDYNEMFDVGLPTYEADLPLVEREESNNANRDDWDTTFGNPNWDGNWPVDGEAT